LRGSSDPEALERIFGRFERAVSAREYGGLGLGLFLAQRIAEAHEGSWTCRPGLSPWHSGWSRPLFSREPALASLR
jgi:signal transduction histidine kinase